MSEVGNAFVRLRPETRGFKSETESSVRGAFSGVGKIVTAAFAGIAAVKLAGFFKDGIKAASDLGEQVNKTKVVFRGSEAGILDWAKTTSKSIGISERAALEATGTFGNMLVPMGFAREEAGQMSTRMVQLAADMASFNNASPAETLDALRAGLAGETEPLRRYGVFLSEATLRQEALSMGLIKGKEKMDAQAKAAATYAVILKQTGDAQGDFTNTSGSLANQQRILAAQWEESKAKLGGIFLPVVTGVVSALNDKLVPAFTMATEKVRQFVSDFSKAEGFRAKLNVVWEGAQEAAQALMDTLRQALSGFDFSSVFGSFNVGAFAVAVDAVRMLGTALREVVGFVTGHGDFFGPFVQNLLTIGAISLGAITALRAVGAAIGFVQAQMAALAALNAATSVSGFAGALGALTPTIAAVAIGIAALVTVVGYLERKFGEAQFSASAAANAMRDYKSATDELAHADQSLIEAKLGRQRAQLNLNRAEADWHRLQREGKTGTAEYKEATQSLNEAKAALTRASLNVKDAQTSLTGTLEKGANAAKTADTQVSLLAKQMDGAVKMGMLSSKEAANLFGASVEAMGKRAGGAATPLGRAELAIAKLAKESGKVPPPGVWHDFFLELGNTARVQLEGTAATAGAKSQAIGASISRGAVTGLAGLDSALGAALAGHVSRAIAIGGAKEHGSGAWQSSIHKIGKPLADGVIIGWLNGTASLPDKIRDSLRKALDAGKKVVDEARAEFSTAFGRLTGDISSAFDALTTQFKTPAEKMLAALAKTEALKSMSDQIVGAMKQITDQFGATTANVDAYNQAIAAQEDAIGRLGEAQAKLEEIRQSGASETSSQFLAATRKVEEAQQAVEQFGVKAAEMQAKIDLGPKIQADVAAYNAALAEQTTAVLALSAAQAKLNELRAAGASKAKIKSAQGQVTSAQGAVLEAGAAVTSTRGTLEGEGIAVDDLDAVMQAQLAREKYYLELQAAEQRLQYEAQRALAKRHLEDRLTDLQEELAKHPGEHKRIQAEIVALLKSYGVNYKNAGAALGRAFAAGLRESIGEVESAAEAIARAIEKVLRLKSPAEEGPLAGIGTWWKALPSTLLGGMDAGAIPAAFGDMAGAARGALSGAFGGGGQTDISAAVEEARVTRDREIVEELRRQTGMGEQANATSAEAMGQVVALLQAAVGLLAERRPVSVSGLFDPNAIAAEAVR